MLARDHLDVLQVLAHGHLRHRAPERAIALLGPVLRERPDDVTVLAAMTLALLRASRPAEALPLAERLGACRPGRSAALASRLLRARALLALERVDEARAEFGRYLDARAGET